MAKLNQPSIKLPKKFWKIRDAAIEYVLSNSLIPEELSALQNWIATDGWEDLLSAWIDEDAALNLKDWTEFELTDSCLRDNEGLESFNSISDEMRVKYAKQAISDAIDLYDDYYSPTVHCYLLTRDDGRTAILGCLVEIHGQGGPFPIWQGVFSDKQSFYIHLKKTGYLIHREADQINDVEILGYWNYEKRNKKRSK